MDSKCVVKMNHITKAFPGIVALNDVSIELNRGELISLCGENGAGKSTLMKILSGEYPYGTYSGEIIVNDKIVKITSNRAAENLGIAMIYQEICVELDLSIAENIFIGCLPKTKFKLIDWKKTNELAKNILVEICVDLDVSKAMRSLSASMQQLVCIARALVRKPSILVLDEPTAALTESETENLMSVINGLKAKGISCIYISHKLDEVFRISDRIIVMRDAKVVSQYLKKDFIPERIIEDMIGRHLDQMYPSMLDRTVGEEVLRAENIKVKHPSSNKFIIEDVSFSIKKGEVLGLAGLVGSGRSELMRAIFGALPMISGQLYIDGVKVSIKSEKEAIEHGLGFLTEERKKDGIVAPMNIGENMTLSILKKLTKYFWINKKQESTIVKEHFELQHIKAPSAKTNITNLSGGNQQKVVLAKSLMTDMRVLFLDEPTRGIDVGAKSEIYKIIKDLSMKGLSIVMVSSEYPELLAMCDRYIILGKGRILGELPKGKATEKDIMRIASFEK